MTEEKKETFFDVFAKCQQEFPTLKKNATVKYGGTSFSYATLEAVLECVLPVLNKSGISLIQEIVEDDNGKLSLTTSVLYEGDVALKNSCPLLVAGKKMQDLGTALTYARRYSIQTLLGLCAEADLDGNVADGPKPAVSTKIFNKLRFLAGVDEQTVNDWLKKCSVSKIEALPLDKYESICNWMLDIISKNNSQTSDDISF